MSSDGPPDGREASEVAGIGPPTYHRPREGANGGDLVLGLSSGTSMDGVDAALVRFGDGPPEVVAHATYPYDDGLRRRLRACAAGGSTAAVARLDVEVGEAFADAARRLLDGAGVGSGEVLCVGSHGQTLLHLPARGTAGEVPATLQIGQPAVIAEATGLTTVADFRRRDMAAGGQGAPLVPLLDLVLYRHPERGRVALNLGGIANVTSLPPAAAPADVIAFDTGPGNVLIDAAARQRRLAGGRDDGGAGAASGRVDDGLLATLRAHPFLALPPPKSADTLEFLGPWDDDWGERGRELETGDLLRTLVEATATTVADAVARWVAPRHRVDEVVVAGGGLHNRTLMEALGRHLGPARLVAAEEVSPVPADAKEAVLFALLARETLAGRPGNVPGATGASRAVVLGAVVPGRSALLTAADRPGKTPWTAPAAPRGRLPGSLSGPGFGGGRR